MERKKNEVKTPKQIEKRIGYGRSRIRGGRKQQKENGKTPAQTEKGNQQQSKGGGTGEP